MQIHILPAVDILIKENRQRVEADIDNSKIMELASSISEVGLIHPVTIRQEESEKVLVAGRRRLKAMEHLWFLGTEVRCGNKVIPENHVPCLFLGEINPIDAEEIELEENIRREDLTWKERADAINRLAALRLAQAKRDGTEPPTVAKIAEDVSGSSEGQHQENVRQDIILGKALQDPKIAPVITNANSRAEAMKLLKRHEETQRNAALAQAIGSKTGTEMHTLQKGDCLSLLPQVPDGSFDVILSDPPYGIGADDFSNSGGKTIGGHFYSDSYERWLELTPGFASHSYRIAKPQAHAYVFCDIDRFHELKGFFEKAGWKCFRTPLIWVNPGAVRAPWPEMGPQRKWQAILYAVKGNRPVSRLYPDVITCGSDPNLGHPAQKPVALLTDLLRRSVRPGDTVIDPFAGSGGIFPAAHSLKCRATGFEMDEAAFGIAAKRIQELTK